MDRSVTELVVYKMFWSFLVRSGEARRPFGVFELTAYFCAAPRLFRRFFSRTREPMDKSGSYGIQGAGGQFVRKLEG